MVSFAHRRLAVRPARRQAVAAAVAAVVLTVAVTAVMHGSATRAASAASSSEGAVSTVEQFGRALASRDFSTICDDLFTSAARDSEGGSQCAPLLKANSVLLQHPRVRLTSLSVRGPQATATVSVTQDHQPQMVELLQLTRERGAFRIASVTSPGD